MASVHQRKPGGKWYACYKGVDGKMRKRVGYVDRKKTLELANRLETEAGLVRDGLLPPAELARRTASRRPVAEHVEDYRRHLIAKGGTAKHAEHVASTLRRLMERAEVRMLNDLSAGRVQSALASIRQSRTPRTANHALGAAQAFGRWLAMERRIEANPLGNLSRFSEEVDRGRERRALSRAEMERLVRAAEGGEPVKLSRNGRRYPEVWITGPERAMLYRLAMETGFRANELRSLTPGSFALDGPDPTVTVEAGYTKNGRRAVQPIRREFAGILAPWVAAREPGKPVLPVPEKTAKLLRRDLAAAGIPYRDDKGRVADFHSLRGSFITGLVRSGVNLKLVQRLARHSDINLTMNRYAHVDGGDLRAAIDRDASDDEA